MTFAPAGPGRSTVAYSVALQLGGSLAGFGGSMLTDTLRRQIGELVQNVEQEIARRPAAGT